MKERENKGVGEGNPKKYNRKCNKPPSSFQGFANSDQGPYFGIFKYLITVLHKIFLTSFKYWNTHSKVILLEKTFD